VSEADAQPLLAIDAGNTRIKWGVHDGRGWSMTGSGPTAESGTLHRAWHGATLAWRVREQPSAALEIPMTWPYAAIPVAALLMAWSLAASARRRWRGPPPA